MSRPSNRKRNELRPLEIKININRYAEGSCIINCGNTKVLCTASIEERVPRFLHKTGNGWVTAEYNMLPRATQDRIPREISKGKPNSRGMEIQRLIGRALRASVDTTKLGERQIIIDCDVLQADGGTRCASITGGFIALYIATRRLLKERKIRQDPITHFIAAVSCGMYKGMSILDLEYEEDSNCDSDVNFVMDDESKIIEIQGTAEKQNFGFNKIEEMYELANQGIKQLIEEQKKVLGVNE
jgi:ribonuclease PH